MLGVGWTEMLVVGIVALIVIGPKDLPMVMQKIGRFAGQVRRMGTEFQRELNKATGLDEVRNLRQAITDPLRKTSEEIRREFNAITPTGTQPTGAIKPSEPGKESVADELRAVAGLPKPEPKPAAAAAAPAAKAAPAPATDKPEAAKPKPRARKPVSAKAAPAAPDDTAPKPRPKRPAAKPAAEKSAGDEA